ncbi:hypothetical protein Tco_0880585 [Tanacetum coccineum]
MRKCKRKEGAKKRKVRHKEEVKKHKEGEKHAYKCLTREDDDFDDMPTYSSDEDKKNRLPPGPKEVLSNMLELKLETEEESSMALELIKFVKQQLEEFEDSNDDETVTSTHEEEERSCGANGSAAGCCTELKTEAVKIRRHKSYFLKTKVILILQEKKFNDNPIKTKVTLKVVKLKIVLKELEVLEM